MEKRTVLFVDDEEDILRTIEKELQDEPYQMLFTTNGKEAFEVLQQNEVHVIVVDMRMPEMSGLDFLKVIKEEYPYIVRMVLSGYAQVTPLLTAINEREIFKYITKPWDSDDELKVAIREAIDRYNSKHEMVVAEVQHREAKLEEKIEDPGDE